VASRCAAAEALGYRVFRGASGRGGVAAASALAHHLAQSSCPAAFVVDGPLGPAGHAKPGVLLCAMQTGRAVWPIAAAVSPSIILPRTWSGIYVPLPFSRVVVAYGTPMRLDPGSLRAEWAAAATALSGQLARARERALEAVRAWPATQRIGH
jgi:lysophospholipid acyltransferase (LPLAT)-like uncharacterized protein